MKLKRLKKALGQHVSDSEDDLVQVDENSDVNIEGESVEESAPSPPKKKTQESKRGYILNFFITIIKKPYLNLFSHLTRLFPMHPFSAPLKTENITVFWCFPGVEKGCIGNKWVKVTRFSYKNVFWITASNSRILDFFMAIVDQGF